MPLAEHDNDCGSSRERLLSFNSRAPRGARPIRFYCDICQHPVSIHVPLAEHDLGGGALLPLPAVSIHVPLAEHDPVVFVDYLQILVSIHVPLAEHDVRRPRLMSGNTAFQFTCPSRSTTALCGQAAAAAGVSIHVPLAEHDRLIDNLLIEVEVSIHVPLAEHDLLDSFSRFFVGGFQFTCPSRSTTSEFRVAALSRQSFNSRAPRGARRAGGRRLHPPIKFQFTCPSRSTTPN